MSRAPARSFTASVYSENADNPIQKVLVNQNVAFGTHYDSSVNRLIHPTGQPYKLIDLRFFEKQWHEEMRMYAADIDENANRISHPNGMPAYQSRVRIFSF